MAVWLLMHHLFTMEMRHVSHWQIVQGVSGVVVRIVVGRSITTAVPISFAVHVVSMRATVGIPHQHRRVTATGVITVMMIAKI